jgi:growth arrest-specific protein 8
LIQDIVSPEYMKAIRVEIRELNKRIAQEEAQSYQVNDERVRMQYFWMIGKKEVEDVEAKLRNKEREVVDLKEKHEMEKKIYM